MMLINHPSLYTLNNLKVTQGHKQKEGMKTSIYSLDIGHSAVMFF
jgi:hypothetical protein